MHLYNIIGTSVSLRVNVYAPWIDRAYQRYIGSSCLYTLACIVYRRIDWWYYSANMTESCLSSIWTYIIHIYMSNDVLAQCDGQCTGILDLAQVQMSINSMCPLFCVNMRYYIKLWLCVVEASLSISLSYHLLDVSVQSLQSWLHIACKSPGK